MTCIRVSHNDNGYSCHQWSNVGNFIEHHCDTSCVSFCICLSSLILTRAPCLASVSRLSLTLNFLASNATHLRGRHTRAWISPIRSTSAYGLFILSALLRPLPTQFIPRRAPTPSTSADILMNPNMNFELIAHRPMVACATTYARHMLPISLPSAKKSSRAPSLFFSGGAIAQTQFPSARATSPAWPF